jgi:hypothetical protein
MFEAVRDDLEAYARGKQDLGILIIRLRHLGFGDITVTQLGALLDEFYADWEEE